MSKSPVTAFHKKARSFVSYLAHLLAYVAPGLAGRLALRMFSTPTRTASREVADVFATAQRWNVGYTGRRLAVWRWRPEAGNGSTVLLVHGWSGHAAQFSAWVPKLLAQGYEVVAFDGPAHGRSEGERTNLIDFAGAIRQVAAVVGGVNAVVAHSMGGAAAVVALSEGLGAERVVLLSTPENVESRIERFASWLKLPRRAREAMERHLAGRFGRPLSAVRLARLAPRIEIPALVIHDVEDREIPWFEGARTAAGLPGGRLHSVRGLGHTRILSDERVIDTAVGFLTELEAASLEMRDANLAAYVRQVA